MHKYIRRRIGDLHVATDDTLADREVVWVSRYISMPEAGFAPRCPRGAVVSKASALEASRHTSSFLVSFTTAVFLSSMSMRF